jgi:hypothetical protein
MKKTIKEKPLELMKKTQSTTKQCAYDKTIKQVASSRNLYTFIITLKKPYYKRS